MVHVADASFRDESCGSRCAVHRGQECWFNFGTLAGQGANACYLETTALDDEIGPSDLDFLTLTGYQALCLGILVLSFLKSHLNSPRPKTGECSVLGVGNTQSASWTRVRSSPLDFPEQFAEKANRENIQHLSLSDSMSWVCASTKGRSSIWSVARRARELCGLCLASNASVRCRWVPSERNPADEPSRRFEWSSQYHARFCVRLQTRGCPDNVCFLG